MIFKAISKTGSLGFCSASLDLGSSDGWLCKTFRFPIELKLGMY